MFEIDGLHSWICEILFLEGKFAELINHCKKHEMGLLNYYFFEIAKLSLVKNDFRNFLKLSKTAGISDDLLIQFLNIQTDINLI